MPPAHDDRLIFSFLDGELDAVEHKAVERRLFSDAVFAARFARLEGMFDDLAALPEAPLAHDLAPEVSRRIAGTGAVVGSGARAASTTANRRSTSRIPPDILSDVMPGAIRTWRVWQLAIVPQIALSTLLLIAAWPWLGTVTVRTLGAVGLGSGSKGALVSWIGAQLSVLQDHVVSSALAVLDTPVVLPETTLDAMSWSINAGALPDTLPLTLFAIIAFALWIATNGALLTPIRSRTRGKRS